MRPPGELGGEPMTDDQLSDFYERLRPGLITRAAKMTGDPALAEDFVDEAWVRFLARLYAIKKERRESSQRETTTVCDGDEMEGRVSPGPVSCASTRKLYSPGASRRGRRIGQRSRPCLCERDAQYLGLGFALLIAARSGSSFAGGSNLVRILGSGRRKSSFASRVSMTISRQLQSRARAVTSPYTTSSS